MTEGTKHPPGTHRIDSGGLTGHRRPWVREGRREALRGAQRNEVARDADAYDLGDDDD